MSSNVPQTMGVICGRRKRLDPWGARIAYRENLRRVIHRDVAHGLLFDQYDYMKRLRANGGAPDTLRNEGIAILIGTYLADRNLAALLGVPDLKSDEIVGLAPRTDEERDAMKAANVID